ncbi:MAG: flippase-like domain-containing protein [Anaerolineae bacterium]|nr:flippase-like domain-containing protein [Anaerolineae bacterium]
MKNRLLTILKLVISAGLLLLLFRLFDVRQSWLALKAMKPGYLILAFGLFQLTLLIRSFRWRFLLDALDVHVPIIRLTYLYYVGVFFNTFLPSGFGGDAVKMYELAHYSERGAASISTVLVDRLAGLVMLFVMGLVAWPWARRSLPSREALLILAVSLVGLLGSGLLFWRALALRLLKLLPGRLGAKALQLYAAVHACGTRALWKALGVSIIFNAVLFLMNYVVALALNVRLPFVYFIAVMPILSLSMLIPSVGALGTREGAYVLLFGPAGVSEPVAIAMSLAFYVINVATGLVGVLWYGAVTLRELRGTSVARPE